MEWRQIPGLSAYEVSEGGNVRCIVDRATHKAGLRKTSKNSDGYWSVSLLPDEGSRRPYAVHHLVCLAFVGPRPTPQHIAAHVDDDKDHNHWSNIYWATQLQNAADRARNGRTARGERIASSTLTSSDVECIRSSYTGRYGQKRSLARRFGISETHVGRILRGVAWVPA